MALASTQVTPSTGMAVCELYRHGCMINSTTISKCLLIALEGLSRRRRNVWKQT